jgi:hypothetical protein
LNQIGIFGLKINYLATLSVAEEVAWENLEDKDGDQKKPSVEIVKAAQKLRFLYNSQRWHSKPRNTGISR